MPDLIIYELDGNEKKWWTETIREFRYQVIKKPEDYIENIIRNLNIRKETLQGVVEDTIKNIRLQSWDIYIKDESKFHRDVLSLLTEQRDLPREILKKIIERNLLNTDLESLTPQELSRKIALIVGDYTGRIVPYIYILSLSTTNSRRARAGKTFEKIIEKLMTILDYPFENQSDLGTQFYRDSGLTKMVDIIIPSKEKYSSDRSNCVIITMKTTLRERWAQVVEEINRTNIPHIYLLTLDDSITPNLVSTLNQYNIKIVLYDSIKETRYSNSNNIIGFDRFFFTDIPHYLEYWNNI